MLYTRCSVLLVFLMLVACGGMSNEELVKDQIFFTFNVNDSHDHSDLMLSDFADIEFVRLGMNESFLMEGTVSSTGKDVFITSSEIYIRDREEVIYVYTNKGIPLRKISRKGAGPEEYQAITSYTIDTLKQELFMVDVLTRKITVYDTAGNFKRKFKSYNAQEISLFNDSLLLCFDQFARVPYFMVSRATGERCLDLPISFQKKIDLNGALAYSSILSNDSVFILSNIETNHIYKLRKDLTISIIAIDESDYGADAVRLHPAIETDNYMLLYKMRSHWITPDIKEEFYVYDKKTKKLEVLSNAPEHYSSIINNYCNIKDFYACENSKICVTIYSPYYLKESIESGVIKDKKIIEMIEQLGEDDNPLLMIMRFK